MIILNDVFLFNLVKLYTNEHTLGPIQTSLNTIIVDTFSSFTTLIVLKVNTAINLSITSNEHENKLLND